MESTQIITEEMIMETPIEYVETFSNEEWKERLDNLLFEKWSYETAGGDNYDALHPEYDSKHDPWFSQKHNDGLKQSYEQAKYDYKELKDSIKYVREQIKKGN
jgi:hypothetical protein